MKYTSLLAALAALLIANQSTNAQGSLTPTGAPAESQKSLQEIYDAIQALKTDVAFLVQQAVPSVPGMVAVLSGTLPEASELAGETVSAFYIGKYEVTWGEWKTVRDWAVVNGYSDLAGVGETYPSGSADNFPVIDVSWYDAVKWCNAKSEKEGLVPVYQVSGAVYKTGQSVPTVNSGANGYGLPKEVEWEWAARGGASSQGYTYSGSNDVNAVAWSYDNSSDGTKAVGTKAANELVIYDMSGNVSEWCEDIVYPVARLVRGGTWNFNADYCTVASRFNTYYPWYGPAYVGFRLARNVP